MLIPFETINAVFDGSAEPVLVGNFKEQTSKEFLCVSINKTANAEIRTIEVYLFASKRDMSFARKRMKRVTRKRMVMEWMSLILVKINKKKGTT